ncbi:ABC transporter substrate-binding protein [Marinibaculum pumilum]|uniref:ABC transporter substrate-binding protein n=1 Tax=Marinibaculum pumilum TaxID=1766165 RepID=A0ABV7L9S9_9PROT
MKALIAVLTAGAFALQAAPADAQVTDDVVKLGLITDMSGLYSDVTGPGSVEAMKMAVEDFGGSVLGNPIVTLSADHQNKADIASTKAREWFDREQLDAIMDVAGSAAALAVLNIARDRNKVAVLSAPAAASIVGEHCTPISVQYVYNTAAMARSTGGAVVGQGGDSWFFITADYAFGHQMEEDTGALVKASGGEVLGAVRSPLNTTDFSSYLLQAQASGAKVIGLALAGGDLVAAIRQASEFGITQGGQRLATLLFFVNDVHSLGLETTQGLTLTSAFYWDSSDAAREWSQRFYDRLGKMPNMMHAGTYSSTMHYLKAVQAAGTDETDAVMAKMREMPIDDFFASGGRIRADGLMEHDMFLFEVKSPEESKGPWDYYRQVARVPGNQAYPSLAESGCPLVTGRTDG